MFDRLFRRHRPQLPTSTSELAEALRAAAPFADDAARHEYQAAADALDRAINITRQHGDEPTRDALAYALGRAELNLKDQMSEQIEVLKELVIAVQGVERGQADQGAAVQGLRAEFQQFGEDLSGRIGGLEQRMDASEHDRKQIRDVVAMLNTRHGTQIEEIAQRLSEIERLLEVAGEHDQHEAGG